MKKYILTYIIILLAGANTVWADGETSKAITSSDITVTVDPATYTGAVQTPVVTVKDGNTLLGAGDYGITYKGSTLQDAKTYVDEIIITGIGNYAGTRYANFKIDPKDINLCSVEGNSANYTGSAINPSANIVVKDVETELTTTDHYTLTVSNTYTYIEPGTYANAITIDGKGNYTGTKNVNFIIVPNGAKNITDGKLLVISNAIYTGATQVPDFSTITVLYDGTELMESDISISYAPNVLEETTETGYKDAKTYGGAITITAKGTNYYGSVTADYVIAPRDLSDDITVTTKELNYLNTEQSIEVEVKYGNNVIDKTNYTFTPTKISEAGHYDVTVTAVENSNLVGSTTADQWVFKSLEGDYADDFTVEPDPIPTQNYTGQEICPTIIVKDKDRVMTIADATSGDYSITYSNNIDPGEATITISGTYAYSGTITKTFKIITEYFVEGDFTYHHAQDGEEVSIGKKENGNNVLATTNTGKVEVPETVEYPENSGHIFTVTGIEEKALGGADITAVVLPQSIAKVENGAFNGADNLRYIDLSTATAFVPSTLQRNIAASPFNGVPKQALVYLNGTTFKGENYVYKAGTGDGPHYYCELFKIYDDMGGDQKHFAESNDYKWAYENVHQFTAYTITNTRMLTAGKHYTTCLPYPIAIPTGIKAYTLSASSDKLLGFEEVTTGTLAAFTPYVLIPTTSGQLLSATNTEVPATTAIVDFKKAGETSATSVGRHKLVGTLRYMATGADGCYIMQSGNTWKAFTGTGGYPTGACILPMRAYIVTSDDYPAEARPFLSATFDSGTNIYNIDDLKFDSEDATYDLSGRKVQTPQKGLYIVGGKKMMRK